jgi:hypothetical protein
MIRPRIITALALLLLWSSCVTPRTSEIMRWDPASAVPDAERDIASAHFRFAYVGGIVPIAPGVPQTDAGYAILHRYPRLEVGPQGCDQTDGVEARDQYAKRYNLRMLRYVAEHR